MYNANATLLKALAQGEIQFKHVLAFIDKRYDFTPTAFKNGTQNNAATENQGSAKVFSFAQLNQLDPAQTLALFAEHFQSVQATPDGTDHQNIRQFMCNGWQGIVFEGQALQPKSNLAEINQQMAARYTAGGTEFTD